MRILIAEDDPSIAAGVSAALRQGGHAVDHVVDGIRADAALKDTPYDLLVLDLGLPGIDGSEVLQRVRKRGSGLPVLVITAREGLRERVRVLDLGADDYLVKPFALAEFEARVRALLRRYTTQGAPEITIGRLRLDLPGHRAWVDDKPLELTDNGLDIAIYRLRRKLADSGTQVRTIRGLGYLLEEVKEADAG